MSEITLTSGMRANLQSLQGNAALTSLTQERLATGRRVNTALDNPTNFFAAAAHSKRADDLQGRKDGMDEAVQAIKAADIGIKGIKNLLATASGIISAARSATTADRATLATQFNDVLDQIDKLATDANYKGTNFLDSGTLKVDFNEDATSNLTVTGFDGSSTGLAVAAAANNWALDANLDTAATAITTANSTLATNSASLASNLSVINARKEFTTSMIANERTGADNLTLADMNEESANMLALQTRQSLGVTALSLASQANQSILRLF